MENRGQSKSEIGIVIRHKEDKTAVVTVEKMKVHPLYHKRIRRMKKVHVHDEKNQTKVGDTVLIHESRPISKLKRWRVVKILAHSKVSQETE
jgi:small subunit ribosomal protein S17